MPNKGQHWNVEGETGDPTMSRPVNDLMKDIKWCEAQKQGKKLNAKRDLKCIEFQKMLCILKEQNAFNQSHEVPTMLKTQFHIIRRTDDISDLETANL